MSAQSVVAVVTGIVAVLGVVWAVMTLTYRIGKLSGTVLAFMGRAATDRAEVLTEIGKLNAKLDGHIEWHGRGK